MPDSNPSPHQTPGAEAAAAADPAVSRVPSASADTPPPNPPISRRVVLPLILFLLTCGSTFLAGVTRWEPILYLAYGFSVGELGIGADPYFLMPLRRAILAHWQDGLIYTGCVLAILLTHEMGHFVMTLIHRVRASLPYFIPLPISPIGTMGAVIGMEAHQANRRQIFDIGLAGPLAGLVVAIPVMWIGAQQLDLKDAAGGGLTLDLPLAMRLAIDHLQPGAYNPQVGVPLSHANPYFMAGWVGLLVTGLNMMPVSQLDGGHVIYALFGRGSHWFARAFMLAVFVYMGVALAVWNLPPTFIVMAYLVLLIGTDHPPTSDDSVPLGWFRTALGAVSLLIPVFCFVPHLRM